MLFSAFAVAAVGGSILTKRLMVFGWETVFATMAVGSAAAFALNTQIRPLKA